MQTSNDSETLFVDIETNFQKQTIYVNFNTFINQKGVYRFFYAIGL